MYSEQSKGETIMKRAPTFLLYFVAFAILCVVPAAAQNAAQSTGSPVAPYDLTKEIKVQGTIQKVDTSGTTAPLGAHVLIQTSQGVVDAHLGFGSAASLANLGISEGASVTVVGMMQTAAGNNVLLARMLSTSSRVLVLRSERGVPVRSFPAANVRPAGALKGTL